MKFDEALPSPVVNPMNQKHTLIKKCLLPIVGLAFLSLPNLSAGHLMVAQNGTLNIVNNYVYIVLSLPISAFNGAGKSIDDDKNGEITLNEFNRHRHKISEEVSKGIYFSAGSYTFLIEGLLLNPAFEHGDTDSHAEVEAELLEESKHIDQITITGRYVLPTIKTNINFNVKLFSDKKKLQRYEITITDKQHNSKYQFDLTPRATFSQIVAEKIQ